MVLRHLPALCVAAPVAIDLSGVRLAPFQSLQAPRRSGGAMAGRRQATLGNAIISTRQPLIASIGVTASTVRAERGSALHLPNRKATRRVQRVLRFPRVTPMAPGVTSGSLQLSAARAITLGDPLEISFDGFQMGGLGLGELRVLSRKSIHSAGQPWQRLASLMSRTSMMQGSYVRASRFEAGQQHGIRSDVLRHGRQAAIQHPNTSEKLPVQVRYRTLAARAQGGSIAVFPAPHKYFMPRDFTTNMGYLWHTSFRGQVSFGIRQLPDDNSHFYPWMNAPPGTGQRMNVFFLLSDGEAQPLLDEVTRYTNRDKFPHGWMAMSLLRRIGISHIRFRRWRRAPTWVPQFKPVLEGHGRGCGNDRRFSRRWSSAGYDRVTAEGTESVLRLLRCTD